MLAVFWGLLCGFLISVPDHLSGTVFLLLEYPSMQQVLAKQEVKVSKSRVGVNAPSVERVHDES